MRDCGAARGTVEGTMWATWRRIVPFIMAAVLLVNLVTAITEGGQGNWLRVAFVAAVLALTIWLRRRADR